MARSKASHVKQLVAGIAAIDEQAAGVLQVQILRPTDGPALVALALDGDGEATRLLKAAGEVLCRIHDAPRKSPLLCGSCPEPLRPDQATTIIIAWVEGSASGPAVAFGFCPRCGAPEKADASAQIALRRIWPNSRILTVGPKGHA